MLGMVVEKPDKRRRQVYEYIAFTKKFCKCLFLLRIEVLNPKCQAAPETALSLVALARDFLPPYSVNGRSLAIKLLTARPWAERGS